MMSEDPTPYGSDPLPSRFTPIGKIVRPADGWIRTLRASQDVTLAELARRLKITPPGVRSFEQAEAADRITLASLRRTSDALDCELIYAFVPRGDIPAAHRAAGTIGESGSPKVTDLTWRAERSER